MQHLFTAQTAAITPNLAAFFHIGKLHLACLSLWGGGELFTCKTGRLLGVVMILYNIIVQSTLP